MLGIAQVPILFGYGSSSLSMWAGWADGTVRDRLLIIQGLMAAMFGGNVAYLGGLYMADLPEWMALMAAGAGGFGGDKFLAPLMQRIFGKATGS